MQVSPKKEIQVAVFIDGDRVGMPKSVQTKLKETYFQCLEELETQRKVRKLKGEILITKIQQLVPEAPIPQKLILAGIQDALFEKITMFTDTCKHIRDYSPEWEENEEISTHPQFTEMADSLSELTVAVRENIVGEEEETYVVIEALFNAIMAQAYLPYSAIITVNEAQKIIPEMSEETKKIILAALTDQDCMQALSDLTFSCKKIIKLKKSGDKGSKELKGLYKKAGKVLLPKVFVMFGKNKAVTDLAQDLMVAAEKAEKHSSWIW